VESFITVNTGKLVWVISARNGLLSTAPKYIIPIMVVNQSMEPIRMSDRLGTALIFSIFAFSSPLLNYDVLGGTCLRIELPDTIYSQIKLNKTDAAYHL